MAINRDYNPFANLDIHIPEAYQADFRKLSRTLGADDPGKTSLEDIPFNRYIDLWTLAAALGYAEQSFALFSGDQAHRFITGQVLQHDLPRIEFLLLLAIAHTKDPFTVVNAKQVIEIAEGYAAGGIPIILEMVDKGHLSKLQNLTRSLAERLSGQP
jgi:hypothetical protein